MVKLSLSVPDDVKKIMDQHKDIQWEQIAQDYLWEYAKKVDLADKLTRGSKLTEKEAEDISAKIKFGLSLKYKK